MGLAKIGMYLISMLRGWCNRLQGLRSVQLSLLVMCCLLLMGLALTTLTQPSAAHTTHLAASHATSAHSESNFSEPSLSASSHSASHKPNCHDRQPTSDWHSTSLLTMCCAWICSAHAVLPNMLTTVFQTVEHVLADPFNFVRIQNPQLAYVRPIERPPRLLA